MRPESTTYSSLPLTTSPLACTPKRNIGAHFVNLSSGLIKYPTLSAGQKMWNIASSCYLPLSIPFSTLISLVQFLPG